MAKQLLLVVNEGKFGYNKWYENSASARFCSVADGYG